MKKFIPIILCLLLISCANNNDSIGTNTPAESTNTTAAETTAAETTAADTTTPAETAFTPTEDNVVWQESTTSLSPLLSNSNAYLEFNGTYGEIEILGELEEIMAKAGDQRIAVQMDMETDNENIKFESVFKNLPEGYADKYHVDGKWTFPVYFLTVEDINSLYCDPEAKFAITSITYEDYLMYESNAKNPA